MANFCTHCGKPIGINEKFCKECGAENPDCLQLEGGSATHFEAKSNSQSKILTDLQRALGTIRKIEGAQVELESIQNEIAAAEKKRVPKRSKIAMIVAFILGFEFVYLFSSEVPLFSGVIVAVVVYITLNIILSPGAKRKAEKAYWDNIPPLMEKEKKCKEVLFNLCKKEESEQTLAAVPEAYTSEICLMFFVDVIQNCRADSLKEAINLYESHLTKMREWELQCAQLEALLKANKISEEQAKIQRAQLQAQEGIFKNTKRIAKSERFGNAVAIVNSVRHWSD